MKRTIFVLAGVLVFGLVGGAYAAGKITGKDIKDGSVTGKDVKNHSLTRKDFRGSVRGPRGFRGPAGPAGVTGARGPAGPQGPAGPINAAGMTRVQQSITVAPGGIDSAEAICPAGQQLITPEFESTGADTEVFYMSDFGTRDSIVVGLDNFDSSVDADVTAIAWCVPTGRAVIASNRARLTRKANRLERRQRAAHLAAAG